MATVATLDERLTYLEQTQRELNSRVSKLSTSRLLEMVPVDEVRSGDKIFTPGGDCIAVKSVNKRCKSGLFSRRTQTVIELVDAYAYDGWLSGYYTKKPKPIEVSAGSLIMRVVKRGWE